MGPGTETVGVQTRKDLKVSSLVTSTVSNLPTSFRMATEESLNNEAMDVSERVHDSTYGVQSLRDTICESLPTDTASGEENEDDLGRRRRTLRPRHRMPIGSDNAPVFDPPLPSTTSSPSPSGPAQHSRVPSMSHSLTSLSLDSQAPLSSLPSSPKSFSNRSSRQSDEDSMDEGGSQAIMSSEEEDAGPSSEVHDSAPQLIMPSIRMPSRRPFTDRGKRLGNLKVLIAGDSGVGKTSLIKSIVQTCEDIVHVDPLSPSLPVVDPSRRSKSSDASAKSTQRITEVYASTKAYPPWWSEIEETTVLRRRKSMGDTVLERNLCFIDTPGYSNRMSKMDSIDSVLQYIKSQLKESFSSPVSGEGNCVSLLSGSGGHQVDVVLYLLSQDIKLEDIVFLQRLAALTNVIPLIAKSDTMSSEEAEILRRSIAERLHSEGVQPFHFGDNKPPYTVCSAPSDDTDTMDASLLMSPEYVRPLIPSELSLLVQQILDKDTALCLRHLAATKLVRANRGSTSLIPYIPQSIPHPSTPPSASRQIVSYNGISPYVQARISDHTQYEERLAQIRLAKWAGDLQRSLENERARYEAIARTDRALWLTEKLDECSDHSSSPDSAMIKSASHDRASPRTRRTQPYGVTDAGDPLGLLRWNEAMKRRGWVAFQVVGSFGILGAIAMWAARNWVGGNGAGEWSWDWWREG